MDMSNEMLTQSACGAVGDHTMAYDDWKDQQLRQKIMNKITDTLKEHLPFSGYERLQELKQIAERIEDEIYTAATSQSAYLRKICFNMLTIETRLLNPMSESDPMQSNFSAVSVSPSEPLDSIAQTGNPNGGDWQEEVYQKIKAMKELYLLDLRPTHSASGTARDPTMEYGNWRAQVQAELRQSIVNKIMDAVKRRFPISGDEGLEELKKIAERFEEKIYFVATSQSDYLQKLSLKMLTMETSSQDPMSVLMQPNSATNSDNPSDQGSDVMQQVNNQGQQLPIPVPSNNIQQMMPQNMHGNVGSTGMQGSSSLSSALPSGSGLQQPTVAGQKSNLQNIQNMPSVLHIQLSGQRYNYSHTQHQQLLQQQMPQPTMPQQQKMTGRQNKLSSLLQPSQQLIGQSTITNVAGQSLNMQNIQNMCNVQQNQFLQQQMLRPDGASCAVSNLTMESGDWRAQLQADSRERITGQILDTLKRNLPFSGHEKLQELNNIAERVEKEIYTAATSQHEYSRKICFMMLSIQTRLQNPMSDPMGSNSAALYNIVKPSVPLDSMANGGDWIEEVYQKIKPLKDLYLLDSTGNSPNGEDWQEEVYKKPQLRQQVMPHMHSQPGRLQQLQRNMPQSGLATASGFQKQNVIDIQQQLCPQKRAMPEASSNLRLNHGTSGAVGDPTLESGDWRVQLQAESRQRIVNKILDTFKRQFSFCGHKGQLELKKIAVRFEEKIYIAATSQSDYLRKISLKMLTMEARPQNSAANSVNPQIQA